MKKLCFLLLLISGLAFGNELVHYTRPAERERGASFADGFESQTRVESNGGTVHGSPTFSAAQGVTLDGSSDYIQYNLTGGEFDSDPLSVIVEFTPSFSASESSVYRYFFQSDNGSGGDLVYIRRDASNNLHAFIGTTVAVASIGSWSSYWKQGERNILILSASNGDNSLWLNGHEIVASAGYGWSSKSSVRLSVGADVSGGNLFLGTIHRFVVFHAKLSDAEAEAYSNGTMWTYENRAVAVWRFRAADHTGTETKESAGRGYDLTINGSPTKLQTHGYEFDGSNDYLSRVDDDTFDPAVHNNDFSVQCVVMYNSISPTNASNYIGKGYSIGNRSWRIRTWHLSGGFEQIYISTDGEVWDVKKVFPDEGNSMAREIMFLTSSYDYITSGTSKLFLAKNNLSRYYNNVLGPPMNSSNRFEIAGIGGSHFLNGIVYYCAYFNEALNQMQHLDFMVRERRKLQEQ